MRPLAKPRDREEGAIAEVKQLCVSGLCLRVPPRLNSCVLGGVLSESVAELKQLRVWAALSESIAEVNSYERGGRVQAK